MSLLRLPTLPNLLRIGASIASSPALLIAASTLAGCTSGDRSQSGLFEPYRIAIPQGNYLNQQMLDQVREGMTREQVRLAIGTPLLSDPFHPDRWDYVFRFQYPNGDAEVRRVTIRFDGDNVSKIDAEKLPERDDDRDPALPGYRPPKAS
jgi:outer membrane protein assembly factor BamE